MSQWFHESSTLLFDLPDAITQGEDRDDAIEMAADCLAETIGARIADRDDIPAPSPLKRGQYRDRGEPIHLIGVEFSKEARNLAAFDVEQA